MAAPVDRMSETLALKASAEAPRGIVASRPPPDLKLVMATQELNEIARTPALDRSQSAGRGGSIGMVVLVAIALVGAAVGLLLVGRGNAGPYILALLAFLAMTGVFSLFALATGILRVAGGETGASPMLKAVVDEAARRPPGHRSARPGDLCQCRLSRSDRCQQSE